MCIVSEQKNKMIFILGYAFEEGVDDRDKLVLTSISLIRFILEIEHGDDRGKGQGY